MELIGTPGVENDMQSLPSQHDIAAQGKQPNYLAMIPFQFLDLRAIYLTLSVFIASL